MKKANGAILGIYHFENAYNPLTTSEALDNVKVGKVDYVTGDTAVLPSNCYTDSTPRVMVINMVNGQLASPSDYFPISQCLLLMKKIDAEYEY